MLILEHLLELKSKQGNVTDVFLHAGVEEGKNTFFKTPRGFQKKGRVL